MPKGKVNIETPARYNDFYDEWLEDTYSYSWKAPSPGSLRGKIRKFLEEYDVTASSHHRLVGQTMRSGYALSADRRTLTTTHGSFLGSAGENPATLEWRRL